MLHKLLLEVPEDIYRALRKTARQTGQHPETLAVEWLAQATRHLQDDPLEAFIGAFESNVSDWADQHDRHIGHAIADRLIDPDGQGHGRPTRIRIGAW